MKNTRRSNKTSKKVPLIIAGFFVLMIATAGEPLWIKVKNLQW